MKQKDGNPNALYRVGEIRGHLLRGKEITTKKKHGLLTALAYLEVYDKDEKIKQTAHKEYERISKILFAEKKDFTPDEEVG